MFTDIQIDHLVQAALNGDGATVYSDAITARPYHTSAHYVVGLGALAAPGASLALRIAHLDASVQSLGDVIAYVASVAERYGADTLGVWFDSEADLLWIDAGSVYYSEINALGAARDAHEAAIWDNANNREIRV